ncbi:MAG TPA: aminoglycoside adenylyltransferase domain-containing protein [Pseudonocardiaceae bacterium]|nr:aminoglycoside adenylyltransferase domain-containing protein [Pseudonocardiaceae bacterium]
MAELRALQDDIPTRPGSWTKHIEGSYADVVSLRDAGGLGVRWLYCDHGHRELIWDTHCNTLHTRWILRHHGIRVAGPSIVDLVDEVPAAAMRDAMRVALPTLLADLRTWAPFDVAWTQRYAVTTYCRILYTLSTARVASKRDALRWGLDNLDPKWRPLLTQALADRALGWDPAEPPRPGSLDATYEFAAYAESFAR